ncbi:hypothetical protein HJG60_011227 [Phyllostomus discolor]|uniref:Uncharacterized protein n=1 Tax=Phyllostomus discolor TaxID=89673 RepID=A0A834A248_9CHIR|nr:hypothetical protein HJG60_011227 [Phyllostomus discolor]
MTLTKVILLRTAAPQASVPAPPFRRALRTNPAAADGRQHQGTFHGAVLRPDCHKALWDLAQHWRTLDGGGCWRQGVLSPPQWSCAVGGPKGRKKRLTGHVRHLQRHLVGPARSTWGQWAIPGLSTRQALLRLLVLTSSYLHHCLLTVYFVQKYFKTLTFQHKKIPVLICGNSKRWKRQVFIGRKPITPIIVCLLKGIQCSCKKDEGVLYKLIWNDVLGIFSRRNARCNLRTQ